MSFIPGAVRAESTPPPERSFRSHVLHGFSLRLLAAEPPLRQSDHYEHEHFVKKKVVKNKVPNPEDSQTAQQVHSPSGPQQWTDGGDEVWEEPDTRTALPVQPDVVESEHEFV